MFNASLNRREIKTTYTLTPDTVSHLGLSRHIHYALKRLVRNYPGRAADIQQCIRNEVYEQGGDPCRWTSFVRDLL